MLKKLLKKTKKKNDLNKNVIARQKQENFTVKTDGIEELYKFIEETTGISLEKSKILVKSQIIELCRQHKISSFKELLNKSKNDDSLLQELINTVTINETYFFREKRQIIETLKKFKKSNHLSILSIPCSSGEEVYSIVILALELGIKNFKVLGIDVNNHILEKAKIGEYTERSLSKLDENLIKKYFIKINNKFKVKDLLKNYVEFKQMNIFDKNMLNIGKFDIIFCRNLFIYFEDNKKLEAYKILEKLKKNKDSVIALGHADISNNLFQYIDNLGDYHVSYKKQIK